MSVVSPNPEVASNTDVVFSPSLESLVLQRFADYAELCRPRIAVMTMVAVSVGFTLGSPIVFDGRTLLLAMFGIVQLVAASSILNQCIERASDGRMQRTLSRPIAAGRVSVIEAAVLAIGLTILGTVILWRLVNPLTAVATLATLLLYLFGYTILKNRTSLCTTIGAIPGAAPPVLGWLAAGKDFGIEALALFALFFVWQFPHFLAIGWIYRSDYRAAGLRMLPSFSDGGFLTGLFAVIYATAFVPVSALPSYVGLSGDYYLGVATVCSLGYLGFSIRFLMERSTVRARHLLLVSLICLPVLLLAIVVDFLRLTAI